MKINDLPPVWIWLTDAGRLLLRQWPVWLLAYGIQFLFIMLFIVGIIVGIGVPVTLLVVPAFQSLGMAALLPAVIAIPIIGGGLFVVLQLNSAWAHATMTIGLDYGAATQAPIVEVFHRGLQRLFRAFWMSFALTLIICGAAFFFLIPLFVILPALLPAWYIAVLEDQPVRSALAMSWARTRGRRMDILGRLLLLLLLLIAFALSLALMQMLPYSGLLLVPLQLILQVAIPVYLMASGYLLYRNISSAASSGDEHPSAPLALLYFFAVWGVMGWLVLAGASYFFIRKIPQLQNLV